MGYIYLINEWGTDNYKIGVTNSNNINKRKKILQTGNSVELHITREFITENPFKLEKMLHRYYFNTHITNEWFKLNDEQVLDFLNLCKKYDDTIKLLISDNYFY